LKSAVRAIREWPRKPPELSIVICSRDDARFAAVTAQLDPAFAGVRHEVIRISDARSMCEGCNRGLARCRGEAVLFMHDDVEFLSPDAGARLLAHLAAVDMVGVAGTSRVVAGAWYRAGQPHIWGQIVAPYAATEEPLLHVYGLAEGKIATGIQALDGVFIAARRKVAERIAFDAALFTGFHVYDMDFSFRAALAGFRLGVAHDILLHHASVSLRNPQVRAAWDADIARFDAKYAPFFEGSAAERPEHTAYPVPAKDGAWPLLERMRGEWARARRAQLEAAAESS
jgi:GT2 family glycosyltransferase